MKKNTKRPDEIYAIQRIKQHVNKDLIKDPIYEPLGQNNPPDFMLKFVSNEVVFVEITNITSYQPINNQLILQKKPLISDKKLQDRLSKKLDIPKECSLIIRCIPPTKKKESFIKLLIQELNITKLNNYEWYNDETVQKQIFISKYPDILITAQLVKNDYGAYPPVLMLDPYPEISNDIQLQAQIILEETIAEKESKMSKIPVEHQETPKWLALINNNPCISSNDYRQAYSSITKKNQENNIKPFFNNILIIDELETIELEIQL